MTMFLIIYKILKDQELLDIMAFLFLYGSQVSYFQFTTPYYVTLSTHNDLKTTALFCHFYQQGIFIYMLIAISNLALTLISELGHYPKDENAVSLAVLLHLTSKPILCIIRLFGLQWLKNIKLSMRSDWRENPG